MVKLVLSNKVISNEKTALVEQGNIVENGKKTATVFNDFFSKIITNLGIPQYIEGEPVSQNIDDPLMKTIIKYRLHPSVIATKEKCVTSFSFSFSQVERDEIIKEISKLKTNKTRQSTDILTKPIKENSDIFGNFNFENFNSSVFYLIFPSPMKNAFVAPVYKKEQKNI